MKLVMVVVALLGGLTVAKRRCECDQKTLQGIDVKADRLLAGGKVGAARTDLSIAATYFGGALAFLGIAGLATGGVSERIVLAIGAGGAVVALAAGVYHGCRGWRRERG